MGFLGWTFLGNTLQGWLAGLLLAAAILLALWGLQRKFVHRFSRRALETKSDVHDLVAELLGRASLALLAVPAVYAGSLALTLPGLVGGWLRTAAVLALLAQIAVWGDELISFWLVRYQRRHLESDAGLVTTVRATGFVVRLALFTLVVIVALDNIPGVQVTSLIASLGIGGIAVALAVQNILADLLASLSIAFDRPFVIGDSIAVGDMSGTVEHVGLKTTRVRSLTGEQLVFPNSDLLRSRIRNYKRMQDRRIAFTLGVTYETPHEKLVQIPGIIREIVEPLPQVRFDRAHFRALGASSLDFEVVYYMLDPDYSLYMDTQQAINLALCRRFAAEGIEFAYPTQAVYVRRDA